MACVKGLKSADVGLVHAAVAVDELLAVVLDDVVVVVHHDGERLADDDGQPHAHVARARTHARLQQRRQHDQRNLRTNAS